MTDPNLIDVPPCLSSCPFPMLIAHPSFVLVLNPFLKCNSAQEIFRLCAAGAGHNFLYVPLFAMTASALRFPLLLLLSRGGSPPSIPLLADHVGVGLIGPGRAR